MKVIFFILVLSFSVGSWAHDLGLENYIKMQEALAADNFEAALGFHKIICDKELDHYKSDYKDCDKSLKDIDTLRTSFKSLSKIYMKHGNKIEMNKFMWAECPMANAKWIQKNGPLRNPYYGKSMLECGEKIQKSPSKS